MKKTIISRMLFFGLAAVMLLASCSETDYMKYDTSGTGIYFTKDTLEFSFGVTPTDITTKEYRIPVCIMGALSDRDREFGYTVVAEETTATEGVQYTIGTPIVPADSIHGYIPVILHRKNLAGDYQNGYVKYKLTLRLTGSDLFTPTLNDKAIVRTLTFDNAVEQPEWLNYKGDKVWYESDWGVWHPLKLIKMVEFFHAIEDILPETYDKMVALYGVNLENVPYADFYVYRTIMTKYVFYPMYEYFANPANKDEILGLYPDFPFDFPDPYAN